MDFEEGCGNRLVRRVFGFVLNVLVSGLAELSNGPGFAVRLGLVGGNLGVDCLDYTTADEGDKPGRRYLGHFGEIFRGCLGAASVNLLVFEVLVCAVGVSAPAMTRAIEANPIAFQRVNSGGRHAGRLWGMGCSGEVSGSLWLNFPPWLLGPLKPRMPIGSIGLDSR